MRKGFTLIEVLVVAVIVAILAAVAIPAYNGYIQSSKEKVAKNTAGTIAAACAAYYSENQNTGVKERIEGWVAAASTAGATIAIPDNPLKLPDDFYSDVVDAGYITVIHKDDSASSSIPWY